MRAKHLLDHVTALCSLIKDFKTNTFNTLIAATHPALPWQTSLSPALPPIALIHLLHPAGRSLNFAICDEVNRFCSHWSQWWDVFKASFSVEFLWISTNITVIPTFCFLFGQRSLDAQLLHLNCYTYIESQY